MDSQFTTPEPRGSDNNMLHPPRLDRQRALGGVSNMPTRESSVYGNFTPPRIYAVGYQEEPQTAQGIIWRVGPYGVFEGIPIAEQDVLHQGSEGGRSLGDWYHEGPRTPSETQTNVSPGTGYLGEEERHFSLDQVPWPMDAVPPLDTGSETTNPRSPQPGLEDEDNLVLGSNGCWEDPSRAPTVEIQRLE